jgi:hypothetical protein
VTGSDATFDLAPDIAAKEARDQTTSEARGSAMWALK